MLFFTCMTLSLGLTFYVSHSLSLYQEICKSDFSVFICSSGCLGECKLIWDVHAESSLLGWLFLALVASVPQFQTQLLDAFLKQEHSSA